MDYDDYDFDDYPCDNCPFNDTCDYWDSKACSMLNDYYGIDYYDPWDI